MNLTKTSGIDRARIGFGMTWGIDAAMPEGLGGPYTAAPTDVGAGLVYAAVFAVLLAADAGAHASVTASHRLSWRTIDPKADAALAPALAVVQGDA